MLAVVTILTKQFKVVMTQRDVRIVDVRLVQINLMMYNLPACTAALAQSMHRFEITSPALTPLFRVIKALGKFFH